jgi:serine/threonine protein kinase
MDCVTGQALSETIRLVRLAGEQQLRALTDALCGALETIHARGLVHGGVHPDHILLRSNDSAVLLDLACARRLILQPGDCASIQLPKSYLPTELLTGENLGPWTDIYGVGATLYRAVVGELPVPAMTRSRCARQVRPTRCRWQSTKVRVCVVDDFCAESIARSCSNPSAVHNRFRSGGKFSIKGWWGPNLSRVPPAQRRTLD